MKKFKIGDLEFLVDAFHPLKFEKGVYAVSIYFTQVMAKNGTDAIEKAKKEYISRRHLTL